MTVTVCWLEARYEKGWIPCEESSLEYMEPAEDDARIWKA